MTKTFLTSLQSKITICIFQQTNDNEIPYNIYSLMIIPSKQAGAGFAWRKHQLRGLWHVNETF